jgi:hypothetical protein
MTLERALQLTAKISYKSQDMQRDWLVLTVIDGGSVALMVNFLRPDSDEPSQTSVIGSSKMIDALDLERWDDRDFLRFVRECIRELELHEVDEFFKVDGKHFINPHEQCTE